MKKIIFLLALIPIAIHAQLTSVCETNSMQFGKQPYHTASVVRNLSDETPMVINTYFIIMESTANEKGLDESDFLAAVAYLNINYNHFNVFFKYRGFEFVDDIFAYNESYYPDRINFRITDSELGAGSGFPFPLNIVGTYKMLTNDENKRFLLVHEVGHILGLIHTNGNTSGTDTNFNPPLDCNGTQVIAGRVPNLNPVDEFTHENVTRNEDDPNFNAHFAGDLVTDTPATYFEVNLCIDDATGTLQYIYSDEVVDNVNVPYEDIDVYNFMVSDDRIEYHEFKTTFTDGQIVRIRETLQNEDVLQPILTTVASLYEPYSGSYYFAGPPQFGNRPLFQPGFDYKFVSAGGQTGTGYQIYNTPSDYDDTSFIFHSNYVLNEVDRFSLDLNSINHPNRSAIVIEQLEDQPRRCYHNVNRGASSGKVTRFIDNIPNQNYTSTQKDSLGINSATLIQDLDSGLYLIEKNYDDGTSEQKIILKGND